MEDITCGLEAQPIACEPLHTSSEAILPHPFRYVTRNIPGPGSDTETFQDQLSGCDCTETCYVQTCPCLTRYGPNYNPTTCQLLPEAVESSHQKPVVECNRECACGSDCSNRVVQRGSGVRLKVAPAGARGFGLFACQDIKRLTFVCEYAGEVIGPSEARRRLERKEGGMNYLIILREHCSTGVLLTCVDPRLTGNVGRFANHSCDPNLLMVPVRIDNNVPRLALFARRNISAGEELTFDYSGETVLSGTKYTDTSCSAVLGNQSWDRTDIDSAGGKALNPDVPENSRQENKTALQEGIDQDAAPNMRISNKHYSKTLNESVKTGTVEKASDTGNNAEKQLCQRNTDVCATDSRKRKLSDMEDWSSRADGRRATSKESPKTKSVPLSDTGRALTDQKPCTGKALPDQKPCTGIALADQKPCYCGSACCKGYLPFEQFIFDS